MATTYRGCKIFPHGDQFAWEDTLYGAESENVFASVEDAKRDIDQFYQPGPSPRVVNGEVAA